MEICFGVPQIPGIQPWDYRMEPVLCSMPARALSSEFRASLGYRDPVSKPNGMGVWWLSPLIPALERLGQEGHPGLSSETLAQGKNPSE